MPRSTPYYDVIEKIDFSRARPRPFWQIYSFFALSCVFPDRPRYESVQWSEIMLPIIWIQFLPYVTSPGRIMTSSILKLTRDPNNVLGSNSGLYRARTKIKTDLETMHHALSNHIGIMGNTTEKGVKISQIGQPEHVVGPLKNRFFVMTSQQEDKYSAKPPQKVTLQTVILKKQLQAVSIHSYEKILRGGVKIGILDYIFVI